MYIVGTRLNHLTEGGGLKDFLKKKKKKKKKKKEIQDRILPEKNIQVNYIVHIVVYR